MKIILRKIKSSPLGEGYNYDFFTPLQLEHRNTVVSFTLNSHSSQYFNILRKYGIAIEKVYTHEYNVREKRKVILEFGMTNFLLVPPTFASNKSKITVYAQELAAVFRRFNFVHFTHFGFLRTQFPKAQIKKILDVFFSQQKLDCVICWDIDEKFHDQMKELLELYLKEHQQNEMVKSYDVSSFVWDESYISFRDNRNSKMRSDVLDKLVETHNELWGAGANVSLQTSRSYKLTKAWQEKLTSIDSKRFVAEYVANKEAGNQSHKIDLVDTVDRVAYELKVSPNNPHFEFYKDVFKVLYANTPIKVIDKLVFCCPLNAERKLGSLAKFVTTLSKQLNLDIEIFYIKDKIQSKQ